ncbi:MAG TPA: selenide, water dikinase SelD [Armatimonadota bacterium]|jgi:selenide,water dikinase
MSHGSGKADRVRLTSLSHGAGCGCKLSPVELTQVLKHLPPILDPAVLVGPESRDDAAVYQLSPELALVLTTDFFTPLVDDPYDFGRIAAANALSDIYAMGAEPKLALSLVAFPARTLSADILAEILRGGAAITQQAGVSLVGGHSIDDTEPKFGLVALGFAHPQRILRNRGARPGDRLVLTKPLGVGILVTALKRDRITEEELQEAVQTMTTLNDRASRALLEVGAHSCTDVTGFGLLGHLKEVLEGSGVGARIFWEQVPFLGQVAGLAKEGVIPGGTERNLASVEELMRWPEGFEEWQRLMLADAQTSGGLLASVPADRVDELLALLRQAGTPAQAVIGEVVAEPAGVVEVV